MGNVLELDRRRELADTREKGLKVIDLQRRVVRVVRLPADWLVC
jgi:hypothetical protein